MARQDSGGEVKPSRELDALVAKVMGWDKKHRILYTGSDDYYWYCTACKEDNNGYELGIEESTGWRDKSQCHGPHYSTDISAAWEVVEKIAPACDGEFRVERDESGQWECEIGYHVNEACYPRIAKG